MSTVTYARDLISFGDVDEARSGGPGLFSRLVAALHQSRQLQAAREIERYRYLANANGIAESDSTR